MLRRNNNELKGSCYTPSFLIQKMSIGKRIGTMLFFGMLISGFYLGGSHIKEIVENKWKDLVHTKVLLTETEEKVNDLEVSLKEKELELQKAKELIKVQQLKQARFDTLLKELERCKDPKIAFAIGYSESRLKKNVRHPTSDLSGIGGLKLQYWGPKLKRAGIHHNTLQAIDYAYNDYKKLYKNSDLALKGYKGTLKNKYSYNLTKAYINIVNKSKTYIVLMNTFKKQKELQRELGLA